MPSTAQGGGMPADRNDESGQFERTFTEDVLLQAIETLGGYATTREIAEEIGSSQSIARRRLRELKNDDRVSAREAGNTYLWEIGDDE